MSDLNCPTCGAALGPRIGTVKMISCAHCGTTSYLEDDQFRAAGQSGVMHDGPQLLALDRPALVAGLRYTPARTDCSDEPCSRLTCKEACHKLLVCGQRKRDRDGDGIPCENVCTRPCR